MAKRRKKKKYGHRKNPRRVAAARRAYKKSGLYKWNKKKHRRGKRRRKSYGKRKRRRGGKRRKSYGRRRKYSSKRAPSSNKGHEIMQRLINRGRSPQQAARVAARIERMRAGKAKRYFENQAVQAKSATALSNVFANIGTAGHLAHLTK